MSFKNMKIPVENNLDEIVVELERMAYEECFWNYDIDTAFLVTWRDGSYSNYSINGDDSIYTLSDDYKETTLAELKLMK